MDNNELYHHGTKGQKWGLRKYQNPDGSLTPEGRRHYGYGDERSRLKAEIKMTRERARADRKMARVQNAERIKYEKQKAKLDAKLQKARNADKEKANRLKEKEAESIVKQQKKQIEALKRRSPLKYARIKPYLNADGTLNDEGKAKFFENGKLKTLKNMSNVDIRNATYRTQLKNQYNEQVYRMNSNDPKKRALRNFGEVVAKGAGAFAGSMALSTAVDAINGGKDEALNNVKSNGKKAAAVALSVMGTTLTRKLGMQSKKGQKAYNAFEEVNPFNKKKSNKTDDLSDSSENKEKSRKNYDAFETKSSKKKSSKSASAPVGKTKKNKKSYSYGEATRMDTDSKTGRERIRRAAHAGQRFYETYNSVYGSRRASSVPTSSSAISVVSSTAPIPVSQVIDYLSR